MGGEGRTGVADGGVKAGGVLGGGVHGGGVTGSAWLERGERRRSLSSSGSRKSSTSLRLFLNRLAGGDEISGGDGCGRGWVSHAVGLAAALPRLVRRRRRRRLFPTVAADVVGSEMKHVSVIVCRPSAWLKDTRAYRPFAKHLPYNAEKSAAQTGGGGLGKAGSPTLGPTPPLTTPAHVGETREVCGGEGFTGWGMACPPGSPATPEEGEAAWRGASRDDRPAAELHPPTPEGGGDRWRDW